MSASSRSIPSETASSPNIRPLRILSSWLHDRGDNYLDARRYLYDGAQAIAEIRNNAVDATYHTGIALDEVLARYAASGNKTLVTDALGSVIAQTDESQSPSNWYAYSPYGETQSIGPDNGNPLQYTGRENDGTGVYYYRARYFDPVGKQWLSDDPIGLAGGINQRAYVEGDPVSRIDPLGLFTISGTMAPENANTIVCDGKGNVIPQVALLDPINQDCLGDCIFIHERSHQRHANRQNPGICLGKPRGVYVNFSDTAEQRYGEIAASEAELSCLRKKLSTLACDVCENIIRKRIKQIEKYRDKFR